MVKKSILLEPYVPMSRPYSKDELLDMRKTLYDEIKLSECKAFHKKCRHKYHVKVNGKKEKEIKEKKFSNNCSVCWKIKNMPDELKNFSFNMVNVYMKEFFHEPDVYTYDSFDLENVFYTWLYKE